MKSKIWVVLSGGPGLLDVKDKEAHDRGWSNYVDPILLRAKQGNLPLAKKEELWWLIYKPAYVARWEDDAKRGANSTKHIDSHATDYVSHLEVRASEHGWNLIWLAEALDVWKAFAKIKKKLSRVWYYGHARDDLWLALDHNAAHVAVMPNSKAVLTRSSIDAKFKKHFSDAPKKYDENRSSKFFGCNTEKFACKWATELGLFSEGAQGKVDFETVHKTGEVGLSTGCTWLKFKPGGDGCSS